MSDLESASKRFIICYLFIQCLDLVNQCVECFVSKGILVFCKSIGIKSRLHLKEAEPSPECIIDHRKTSIGSIHHTDDIQILRYRERHSTISQSRLCATIILLDQHQKLTKDFAHVSSVDLIDDEEEFLIRIIRSRLTEAIENSICKFEISTVRTITHDEILIGIVLMKLNHLDTGIIHLSHHSIRKLLGCECLSNTRRAL